MIIILLKIKKLFEKIIITQMVKKYKSYIIMQKYMIKKNK